jgi:hypothetical protein
MRRPQKGFSVRAPRAGLGKAVQSDRPSLAVRSRAALVFPGTAPPSLCGFPLAPPPNGPTQDGLEKLDKETKDFVDAAYGLKSAGVDLPVESLADAIEKRKSRYCKTATPTACAFYRGQAVQCAQEATMSISIYEEVRQFKLNSSPQRTELAYQLR